MDHPAEQTEAEVRLSGTDVAVSARVEVVHEGVVCVRPSASEFVEGSVVKPGDAVEVCWRGEAGHRMLPDVGTTMALTVRFEDGPPVCRARSSASRRAAPAGS
ncbi:hypothetical protein [Blastococcus sp. SYSU DS0533]